MKIFPYLATLMLTAFLSATTSFAAGGSTGVVYEGRKAIAVHTLEALEGTVVDTRRVLSDGEFVITHSRYTSGDGVTLGFELFKFEGDVVVERTGIFQPDTGLNPSGRTGLDGPYIVDDLDATDANKALVEDFFSDAFLKGDYSRFEKYFDGDHYIQHNLAIADGISSLFAYIQKLAADGIVVKFNKIKRVMGEGNFVLVISEATFGSQPTSFYDLYHVVDGRISEHWDVISPIK